MAERKFSRKRGAILERIRSTTLHPSADWVYGELKPVIPDLSLGTVYRNLALFREDGTIVSVGVVNGEERFDGDTSEHAHFICTGCGAVIDVGGDHDDGAVEALRRRHGFEVMRRSLTYYGLCEKCK